MRAHVAHLAGAEVPKHIPLQAIRARSAGEIPGVVRVVGRGPDPLVVVQGLRRRSLGGQVTRARQLAVAPREDALEVSHGTVTDHLLHAAEVRDRMALGAGLRRELGALLEVLRPHQTRFLHREGDRLFHVDVLVTVHRPDRDVRVLMVRRAADDRVDVLHLLVEQLAPIDVGLRSREGLERVGKAQLVDVAERDDVFLPQRVVVREAAAPDTDQRDVEFVARTILAEQRPRGENQEAGAGGGGRLQEVAAIKGFHRGASVARPAHAVNAARLAQARISFTTWPWTSVRR